MPFLRPEAVTLRFLRLDPLLADAAFRPYAAFPVTKRLLSVRSNSNHTAQGFVKSIPIEIEEAAMIDGCNPVRTFFSVVLPIMQPTYISVGILETMWIWNDFLLPYLVLDINKYKTISIAIQYMKGSYGRVDMGAIMAALIMAVIPVIIFYLACQKYIIEGVAAGAVKG